MKEKKKKPYQIQIQKSKLDQQKRLTVKKSWDYLIKLKYLKKNQVVLGELRIPGRTMKSKFVWVEFISIYYYHYLLFLVVVVVLNRKLLRNGEVSVNVSEKYGQDGKMATAFICLFLLCLFICLFFFLFCISLLFW